LSSAAGESTTMALLLSCFLLHLPAWARTKLSAKELEALLCLRSRAMLPFRRAIVPAGSHQVFASQRDARSTKSAPHPLRGGCPSSIVVSKVTTLTTSTLLRRRPRPTRAPPAGEWSGVDVMKITERANAGRRGRSGRARGGLPARAAVIRLAAAFTSSGR
jgi:hypothetical protein